jgi:hypothetical protein
MLYEDVMRAFTLGSCLAVAVTLASSGNLMLEGWLRILPDPRLRAPRREARPAELDSNRLSRAFRTPLRPKTGPVSRRALPLKLVGTLDAHAAAMVEVSSGHCRTLRVGDRWDGVELLEIGHGRATVRREGLLEEITVGATIASSSPVTSSLPITFSQRGAEISMPRAELERQLPDFAKRLISGGRVIPAFAGSKMIGLRLLAVKPESLYSELGLLSGDLLETVNGVSLTSPEVALGLTSQLREQSRISVGVNRGGERLMWNLSLD